MHASELVSPSEYSRSSVPPSCDMHSSLPGRSNPQFSAPVTYTAARWVSSNFETMKTLSGTHVGTDLRMMSLFEPFRMKLVMIKEVQIRPAIR
jgi:hypothetical protein